MDYIGSEPVGGSNIAYFFSDFPDCQAFRDDVKFIIGGARWWSRNTRCGATYTLPPAGKNGVSLCDFGGPVSQVRLVVDETSSDSAGL